MATEEQIVQAYKALQHASLIIGKNNYKIQTTKYLKQHKTLSLFKFTVTPEHAELCKAMNDLYSDKITPEEAMSLLWQYDTMKQRGL